MDLDREKFNITTSGRVSSEYLGLIENAAKELPILGDTNTEEVHCFFHYSTSENITEFNVRQGVFCWTDILSFNPQQLNRVTGLFDCEDFSTIYVIRVGITGAMGRLKESPIIRVSGGRPVGAEYELNQAVSRNAFAKVHISLNDSNGTFIVAPDN